MSKKSHNSRQEGLKIALRYLIFDTITKQAAAMKSIVHIRSLVNSLPLDLPIIWYWSSMTVFQGLYRCLGTLCDTVIFFNYSITNVTLLIHCCNLLREVSDFKAIILTEIYIYIYITFKLIIYHLFLQLILNSRTYLTRILLTQNSRYLELFPWFLEFIV
jgi:hypothetical protein